MIKIYQIPNETLRELFENNKFVVVSKILIGLHTPIEYEFSSLYVKVWEGDIGTDDLEEIFDKFNMDKPENYNHKSMSSGDIVELQDGKYICRISSWEKLSY